MVAYEEAMLAEVTAPPLLSRLRQFFAPAFQLSLFSIPRSRGGS
jgi:hypothetical protein